VSRNPFKLESNENIDYSYIFSNKHKHNGCKHSKCQINPLEIERTKEKDLLKMMGCDCDSGDSDDCEECTMGVEKCVHCNVSLKKGNSEHELFCPVKQIEQQYLKLCNLQTA